MAQPATKELTFEVTPHEADTSEWKQFKDRDIYKHYHSCTVTGCQERLDEATCSGDGTPGYFVQDECDVCKNPYGSYATDEVDPTGEIKVSEKTWTKLLNKITFGLFFKETQKATVTASDDSYSQPGYTADKAVKVEYYLDNNGQPLDVAALKDKTFTAYDAANGISLNPDQQYVVYVKLMDHAGNLTYLSTDGIVIDSTKPAITLSGYDTGSTAETDKVDITVTAGISGVKKVEVEKDGKREDITDTYQNGYTVKENGTYTFIVTSKADVSDQRSLTYTKLTPKPIEYQITKGDKSTWKKGSKEGLTITVDGDRAKFSELKIDEKTVEEEAYTAESGSTVIRLAPGYLEKLSVGSHSITVLYTDGKAEGTFTIADADTSGGDSSDQKTPGGDMSDQKPSGGDPGDSDRSVGPQAGSQPQTGDNNSPSLWIMLLLLSLAGIGGTVICGRRKALNSK